MTGTSDERALATRLSGLDPASLAALLVRRRVVASTAWADTFDAAEALLEAASIDAALRTLSRDDLIALSQAAPAPTPAALALAHENGTPFGAVAARLDLARAANPHAFDAVTAPASPAAASPLGSDAAAERAAGAVSSLADVLAMSRIRPLPTTAAQSVTAAERRRLVDEGVIGAPADLDDLLTAAQAAHLLLLREREWRMTTTGDAWLAQDAVARWQSVALGIVSLLAHDADGELLPPAAWTGAHPLDPNAGTVAEERRRLAVRWGLLTPGGEAPAWSIGLWEDGTVQPSSLSALLTPEVDGIYLQADLSAIAPGPLRPALDLRLRTMAHRESRAQASTYRFSEQSLAAAVAGGETSPSLHEFLRTVSLTGIPQPLEYLIDQVTSSRGMLRVSTDAATGRALVGSDDPHLIDTLLVDRTLRALGLRPAVGAHPDVDTNAALDTNATLRPAERTVVSRVSRDAVYWSLVDARYRVTALDANGDPEPLDRQRALVVPQESRKLDDLLPLAERLLAGRGDSDAAWLERELDQAVRLRAPVVLTVRLPNGSTRELTVEAQGLGGGRFRGLDRAADVERTVPLRSIDKVRPA